MHDVYTSMNLPVDEFLFPQCFQKSFSFRIREPHSSVSRVQGLRTGGFWFDPWAWPVFFLRIDHSHCNGINSSPSSTVHGFNSDYVGKQHVENWSKIIPGKHGKVHWPPRYCRNNVENSINPFPNKPWFLCVCSISLLKTLIWSNFSFIHSVFYPFSELSAIFVKFKTVVCKCF